MIRCITIDDNAHDLEIMGDHIARIPFLELLHAFNNAFDAIEFMDRESIDLIITDAEMPAPNGLEFLGSLRRRPCCIIVAEQERYAVEAFALGAIDYLLKPFSFERFLTAVVRVREQMRIRTQTNIPLQGEAPRPDYIFIKSDCKTIRVDMGDILFVQAMREYVKLYTLNNPVISLFSLNALEQSLPPERFMRIHRSYIVALNRIDVVEKKRILIGNHSIKIGDMYRSAFMKKIQLLK